MKWTILTGGIALNILVGVMCLLCGNPCGILNFLTALFLAIMGFVLK